MAEPTGITIPGVPKSIPRARYAEVIASLGLKHETAKPRVPPRWHIRDRRGTERGADGRQGHPGRGWPRTRANTCSPSTRAVMSIWISTGHVDGFDYDANPETDEPTLTIGLAHTWFPYARVAVRGPDADATVLLRSAELRALAALLLAEAEHCDRQDPPSREVTR
jgi:hypothetical protein